MSTTRTRELAPRVSAQPDAAVATGAALPTRTPMALEHADLLCIRNGPGTRLRVASGVLWLTEEGDLEDHVLSSGDVIILARRGTALVYTFRPARVVMEVPVGVAPPDAVQTFLAGGQGERPGPLPTPAARSLTTMLRAAAIAVGRALASFGKTATTLWPDPESGNAGAARSDASVLYSDDFPTRHLRHRWMYRSSTAIDS